MRLLQGVILFFLFLVLNTVVLAQPCDYTAGNTCGTAPVICDLNCLDGFEATLFPAATVAPFLSEQPSLLCFEAGSGYGSPTNMSWFAFIAGSDSASISVIPSNCQNGDGIQVGLFDDCDFSNTDITNPNFDAAEFIACNTTTTYPNPVIISTNELEPYKTYYFFVDGVDGDVCEYTVNVIYSEPTNPLPNLQFFGKDTLITCPNSEFDLMPDDYHLDIEYYWKIDPPTPKYPYSNFTKLDSITTWRIAQQGTYTISMFAYNRCDATDTVKKVVVIQDLVDEVFDDVTICQNKFPYAGPLDQDKNGDGLGWQGPNITGPGIKSYQIIQPDGCSYDQIVNVAQYNLQPVENVVVVDCQPYKIFGLDINQTELDISHFLPNADKHGCDSLINLDAYILSVSGNMVTQNCQNGKISLGYNITGVSAPSPYTIDYEWKDGNGNTLPDSDGNPSNIDIDKATNVNLSLVLTAYGKSCRLDQTAINIDPALSLPGTPTPLSWDITFCEDQYLQSIGVASQPGVTSYTWDVGNNVSIVGNNTGSNVQLDFSNIGAGVSIPICVSANNGCGNSPEYCQNFTKIEKPSIAIEGPESVCVNETTSFEVSKLNQASINNFQWTHIGGTLISGNTSGPGPLNLRYNTPGSYQISAVANNAECASPAANFFFTVLPNVAAPLVSTQSYADKIQVNWNAVPCAVSYNCFVDGILTTNTQSTEVLISGLQKNQTLFIRIEAVGGECACGMASSTVAVKTLTCTEVTLDLISASALICETDWELPFQFTYQMNGNLSSGNLRWSGSGVNQNGQIRPDLLGAGNHTVYLTYDELGCTYVDSFVINLARTPNANIQTEDPQCKEDTQGSVKVLPTNSNDLLNYILDGKPMEEGDLSMVEIGQHNIQIIDANRCSIVKEFIINPPKYPELQIKATGKEPYYDNESINYQLIDMNQQSGLIDSIVWLINGEVVCSGDCSDLNLENYKSGIYNHQVLVYYKNCELRQDFEMQVKESPKVFTSNVLLADGRPGLNGGFKILSNDDELEILSLDIFGRWGEKVFSKNNFIPSETEVIWDGKINGEYVLPGVYVFKLTFRNEKDEIITQVKDITVIR